MSWFHHDTIDKTQREIISKVLAWNKHDPVIEISQKELDGVLKGLNKLYFIINEERAAEYDNKELERISLRINQVNATIKAVEQLQVVNKRAGVR
jgi:hypothetical protein